MIEPQLSVIVMTPHNHQTIRKILAHLHTQTAHFDFSKMASAFPLQFSEGQLFAARSRRWSLAKRALYVVAAPLIPVVRLAKLIREMSRPGRRLPWRVLPLLVAELVVDGCGELVGYLCGAGDAMATLTEMELHRAHYLTAADRRAFEELPA